MKNNLRLLSIIFLVFFGSAGYAQTVVFNPTGVSYFTYTVPAGVTSIKADLLGGIGGLSSSSNGGCGGGVHCLIAVTPGEVLNIFPGSAGGDASIYAGGTGGFTGPSTNVTGGAGATSLSFTGGSGGGGGASDIRIGGIGLGNRVVAAGGGGGGGDDGCGLETGGNGGGIVTLATDGQDCGAYNAFSCGAAGTTLGPGAGSGGGGFSGVSTTGGAGIPTSTYYFSPFGGYYYTYTDGGGGGGGFYGGGGGSAGGGGGGSGWANLAVCSSVTGLAGENCTGDGSITICAPVPGTIVGSPTLCTGPAVTYTNPTATPGGTWTSSVPAVATVNPVTGVVTPGITGVTVLTYTTPATACGSGSTSLTITVVTGIAGITGRLSECFGDADTLFDASPGGTWNSLSPGVATIDPVTGIITTTGAGTSVIQYTDGGCTVSATLTVNPLPAAIVGPTAVCRFSTITLTDLSLGGTWSSTVPLAATVGSSTGVVTGVGPGGSATNIIYTLPSGCSIAQFVSVSTPPLAIAGPGQVCAANAIILTELVGGGTWATSFPLVASVTSGVVTGLTPGVDTISYTMPSCPRVTHIVTVNPEPSAIYGPTAVCLGMATTLIDTTAGGSWSSLNPLITVTPGGVVTTLDTGVSGTIVYTLPTTCFVTVTVNTGSTPHAIAGPSSVCQGQTVTLTDSTPGGVWSSTDLAIARIVDTSGVDSGISAGLVNISYTLPSGCFAEMPFVVNPPVTPMITISNLDTGILCETSLDTFVAIPTNGGMPTYQWTKFSVPIPGATSDTFSYMPIHGDVINCVMVASGVCALNDTATDSFVVNVYPADMAPGITIMTGNADTIAYVGEIVTFFSSVIWGGTSPTYQWYMNHVPIPGATASSYTTPVYATDTFFCIVNGNPPCESSTPLPGVSNPIIIHDYLGVNPLTANGNYFSLFPNPNNGSFTLTGTLANVKDNEVNYEVIDMLGQVVYNGKTMPQNGKITAQISLTNLAAGSYMLRVNTDNTSETFHFVIGK